MRPDAQPSEPSTDAAADIDDADTDELIRQFFADRQNGLAAVYLFGSQARGEDRATSDVDIAVLFTKDPPRTLDGLHLDWAADLGAKLGCTVEVVILNFATAEFAHLVRRDGELLLELDREARVLHEVRSRNEYFDLLPILRRYRNSEMF